MAGNVQYWDATDVTHIPSSPIRFSHVFLFNTGTSIGSISGQFRPISSVDFRPLVGTFISNRRSKR
ncbi:hypothetical protein KIN20_011234 [Parelaphostrongylus tenuis]|uniref:Uncharacterized protein n=1 Tax=Parelaphostrongylus tenuis TaxID=148309 RepID=A0AAD5M936_PARTN|nr:hypothetical protein KIN20_011234 [Parelaphostrongylus tenuis]